MVTVPTEGFCSVCEEGAIMQALDPELIDHSCFGRVCEDCLTHALAADAWLNHTKGYKRPK